VGPDLSLACRRVRLAAAHTIDVQAINEAERLGFSRLTGSIVPRPFDFAMAIRARNHVPPQHQNQQKWPLSHTS
jgi:hypothetical protein